MKEKKFILFAVISMLFAMLFFYEAVTSHQFTYSLPFVTYGGTFAYNSIRLFEVDIHLYWIMMALGQINMILFCISRRNLVDISKIQAFILGLLLGILGYVGAKILFTLENYQATLTQGFSFDGVSFFGTVFFMPLVIPIIAVFMKRPSLKMIDFCAPAGILMLAFIRIGCFFNGCCEGKTYWMNGNPVIVPAQLIEVTFDFLLIFVLLSLEKKNKCTGLIYALFMGIYGFYRFFLEFIRNSQIHRGILTDGQYYALAAMFICIVSIIINRRAKKKNEK